MPAVTTPAETLDLIAALRILVVDDEPELLEILGEWFACCGTQIQTASDGFQAVALARQTPFDVIITDLKMPGMDGLQLLSIVKELDPMVEVIFLTGTGTMDDAISALREGRAFDFLQKPLKNLTQLNDVIARAALRRAQRAADAPRKGPLPVPSHLEELSPRELDILALLAQGMDNRAIADKLCNSEKTIKNHLTRIYEKLKVKNRTQALLVCQQYGLL
ncbi:Response regulator protein TodT [compost metagenome]